MWLKSNRNVIVSLQISYFTLLTKITDYTHLSDELVKEMLLRYISEMGPIFLKHCESYCRYKSVRPELFTSESPLNLHCPTR